MSSWLADRPLVLASKSESRRVTLEQAGIPIEICPADIDERAIEARAGADTPGEAAALLAREKARTVAACMPGRFVLGADQTLALGTRRFSKPADVAAARAQLNELKGRTHELHSAIALIGEGVLVFEHVEVARMTMRDFSDAFLESYLASAGRAVTASVGAYQVEKFGIQLFARIEGDHFTILGMPLLALLERLRRAGLLVR